MHVRVRIFGKPDVIVVVESKLTKIDKFRQILQDKFDVKQNMQRLFYGGKLLENGYTFHDYNIKLNDVIQLMVRVQASPEMETKKSSDEKKCDKVEYKDAESMLYAIGDFVDMRDKEQGAWFEGKIMRIVHNPDAPNSTSSEQSIKNKENNPENKQPEVIEEKQTNSIAKFFGKTPKWKKLSERNQDEDTKTDKNLLFQVQIEGDEDNSDMYCKVNDLRPRARTVIEVKELKIGQKVMVNYNPEQPHEKGYWYDFKVSEIVKKLRNTYELIGTVYLGLDAVPQNDTKVGLHDKIFAIEEVVPLAERTDDYKRELPEKRSCPLNCLTCRDDEDAPCKDCGCYLCSGKEFPEKIVLCDECNKGYHMECLEPPITELPEEDWYCPDCKRDPNDIIAPGAAKQTKKRQTKSNRDWGRGMACVGKTKTCSMPPNHFGPIPGIEVGMCWRFRIQLSESGVHRPPVSGIHGRDVEGAYSIVLSGGYEDDVDFGYEFTYTGSGGRDLSGNKRTAEQSCDQTLTRENKALARNCAVKRVCDEGDDAGEAWRDGRPVRVVRSYKMIKHFPKYAPKEGIRYDGIYKVVKYYPEKGISGYRVWKYLLRRDDPTPAPWEKDAKQFNIIYPDGYLEAEAEKKALKEKNSKVVKGPKGLKPKKRALKESNHTTDEEASPPAKKPKNDKDKTKSDTPKSDVIKRKGRRPKNKSPAKSPETSKNKILEMFNKSPKSKSPKSGSDKSTSGNEQPTNESEKATSVTSLTAKEIEIINADTLNSKLWQECIDICKEQGKKEFVEYVSQIFICIICQEVAVIPTTTPCFHNFCMACIKHAFKATGCQTCPCCRRQLSKYEPEPNEQLKAALRQVMAGYDAGKK